MSRISRRQFIANLSGAFTIPAALFGVSSQAQANVLDRELEITSVSWIDAEGLPDLSSFEGIISAVNLYWPLKVMVGLVGTSNPRPPKSLPANFRPSMQFRSMTAFKIARNGEVSNSFLDSGYTPPVDKTKLPLYIKSFVPGGTTFYPGQASAISGVLQGSLHPASTLSVPAGYNVLASVMIKFRAGPHTNKVGISLAKSPYHVPWVWCEHALIKQGDRLALIANGSRFPSHAWYVNGESIGSLIQRPVTISDKEPALATGKPVVSGESLDTTFGNPDNDKAPGLIKSQPNTVPPRREAQIAINIPMS